MVMIQQDNTRATYNIQRYEPGKIWINQICYTHSVILRPHTLMSWPPQDYSALRIEDFFPLIENSPEILILGTGSSMIIPAIDFLYPLQEKGIAVEFMDSRKASYTFTILAAEQRDVAACILIL